MVITYLIGNGFDINLGLHTKYKEFISEYVKSNTEDARVKVFKEAIRNDLETDVDLWKDAEMAFGEKTKDFCEELNPGRKYNTCEIDFCNSLAEYLNREQNRFKPEYYESNQILLKDIANSLIDVAKGLKKAPKDEVQSYLNDLPGGVQLNFMVFNYTFTIDFLLKKAKAFLGERYYRGTRTGNIIKDIIHPHGTIEGDMVFGVNDRSQLAAPEIFDNDQIDLSAIIKEETNKVNEENLEQESIKVLESSDLIYIYGMSLGETDKRWWERILKLMLSNNNLRLILALHSEPTRDVLNTAYLRKKEKVIKTFLSYGDNITEEERKSFSDRIYFDTTNKFEKLKDIVPSQVEEAYKKRLKKTM